MKCPSCGEVELLQGTQPMQHTYKGQSTEIEVSGNWCAACGEVIIDAAEAPRVSAAMLAFNRKVNAELLPVDPDFIASVRKKLAIDQRQAAEIFGGGVNAFSRYETGKTKPPLALVKLLKLLDQHPELWNEVKTA